MNHLTDTELIDYTLKFDEDPVRVRLAKVMDNTSGCLLDSLYDVGMDSETWLFENTYDAGQWIRHLENEIEFLSNELAEAQEKLHALEKRTVLDFMVEVGQTVQTLEVRLANAEHDAKEAKSKLSMWTKLNGQGL